MLTLTNAAATAGADLPTVVMEVSSRDTQQLVLRTFGGKARPDPRPSPGGQDDRLYRRIACHDIATTSKDYMHGGCMPIQSGVI